MKYTDYDTVEPTEILSGCSFDPIFGDFWDEATDRKKKQSDEAIGNLEKDISEIPGRKFQMVLNIVKVHTDKSVE
ncbi:MAG: hypothetical protein Q4B26_04005 [Eubacteriales bacterium]|nr:hypothetical protein [Eubacteriales bacterium]